MDCPDKEKDTKCFKYGNFGHVSTKYTKIDKDKTSGRIVRIDTIKSGRQKDVQHSHNLENVTAIVDSGRDLHLIYHGLYKQLDALELKQILVPFDKVRSVNNRTLGRFQTEVIIDGLTFTFTFDVIADDLVSHNLIIGGELSDQAKIKLKKRQMTLIKFNETEKQSKDNQSLIGCVNVNWKTVLQINTDKKKRKRRTE